jgi:mono/diheme cytochrome c family protein
VYRFTLVLPAVFFLAITAVAQSSTSGSQSAAAQNVPSYSAIPVEAAKAPNPVKSSPESLARAKKWWGLDCAMCHGANGNGQGDTAKEMKLKLVDFTDSKTLKERTDGEVYYIIKNGHNDMPAEGPRIKTEEGWDLVNYVRSLTKGKEAEGKSQ